MTNEVAGNRQNWDCGWEIFYGGAAGGRALAMLDTRWGSLQLYDSKWVYAKKS